MAKDKYSMRKTGPLVPASTRPKKIPVVADFEEEDEEDPLPLVNKEEEVEETETD